MTTLALVRRRLRLMRSKEALAPDIEPYGPRDIRFTEDERQVYIGIFVFMGLLALVGVGIEVLGPSKSDGIGYALPGVTMSFVAWIWLFAWRPMVSGRALIRHGNYAKARVVGFSRPWWSTVLYVLRPFLVLASRAALSAEVGYRLTLAVPDEDGGYRKLERIVWRAFVGSLPMRGQVAGVFYDPQRIDRFVFATDLERMNIEVVGAQQD